MGKLLVVNVNSDKEDLEHQNEEQAVCTPPHKTCFVRDFVDSDMASTSTPARGI